MITYIYTFCGLGISTGLRSDCLSHFHSIWVLSRETCMRVGGAGIISELSYHIWQPLLVYGWVFSWNTRMWLHHVAGSSSPHRAKASGPRQETRPICLYDPAWEVIEHHFWQILLVTAVPKAHPISRGKKIVSTSLWSSSKVLVSFSVIQSFMTWF